MINHAFPGRSTIIKPYWRPTAVVFATDQMYFNFSKVKINSHTKNYVYDGEFYYSKGIPSVTSTIIDLDV